MLLCQSMFNNKHIGINLFKLQLCVHKYMFQKCVKKAQKLLKMFGVTS